MSTAPMDMADIQVGNQVTLINAGGWGYGHRIMRFTTVIRRMKQYFVTESGTKWAYTGKPYGDRYSSQWVIKFSPEHKVAKEQADVKSSMESYVVNTWSKYRDWDMPKLRSVAKAMGWQP